MRRIGVTIPVALVLTTVLMVASTLAATAVSDRELRRAKQCREDFGLTSSTRVVRESLGKPKLVANAYWRFGHSLRAWWGRCRASLTVVFAEVIDV